MALIKFGSVITDTRGTLGGHTFKWSAAGSLVVDKPHPPHRRSHTQSVIRARFTSLSKAWWLTLTSSQRDDWRALAAANPLPNRWGDDFPLTGLAFFIRVNQRLLASNIGAIFDAPSDQTVSAVTDATFTATAPSTASLAFTPGTVPANHVLIFRATPEQSPGRSTPQGGLLRIATAAASTTSPLDVSTDLLAALGSINPGRQIFTSTSFLNVDTGAESPPIASAAIVA